MTAETEAKPKLCPLCLGQRRVTLRGNGGLVQVLPDGVEREMPFQAITMQCHVCLGAALVPEELELLLPENPAITAFLADAAALAARATQLTPTAVQLVACLACGGGGQTETEAGRPQKCEACGGRGMLESNDVP